MIRFSFIATLLLSTASLLGDCCGGPTGANIFQQNSLQHDFPLLNQGINSKRSIPVEEKSKNLSFSGDIRVAWAHLTEKLDCGSIRGQPAITIPSCTCFNCGPTNGAFTPFPSNAYGVEFNFYVDYVQDCAWGVAWLQYSNEAGLVGANRGCTNTLADQACRGSGDCEGICLRKAYIGYNLIADGCLRVDLELGRRPLWTIFDSRVEFNQNFDGVLLSTAYNFMDCSDIYLNWGAFIIDERVHHYGWVGEFGYLNILNSGFDVKYSLIDWSKEGPNRCKQRNAIGNQFLVSQVLGYWNLEYDYLWNSMQIYGAFLQNLKAPRLPSLFNKPHDLGWYVGFLIGEICKQGDWALDVNYQYVEALCVPECDLSGIGLGNAFGECFSCGTGRGTTNYQGWRFETLYAFTDNFFADVVLQFGRQIDRDIGGKHNFSQFQMEAIYAF